MAGVNDPNIFKLAEILKKSQTLQELRVAQHDAGQSDTPKKAKYVHLNERLKTLVTRYDVPGQTTLSIDKFLRKIAMNLVF